MKKLTIRYGAFALGAFLTALFLSHALCGTDRTGATEINLLLILFAGSFIFTLADDGPAVWVVISISLPIILLTAFFVLSDPDTWPGIRIPAIAIGVSSIGAAIAWWWKGR